MNEAFVEHGYETVDDWAGIGTLNARIIFDGGLTLGASAGGLGQRHAEGSAAYDAELNYFQGRADVGYALLRSRRILLHPALSLGGYAANLRLSDDRDANFDALLDTPGTTTELTAPGLLLGATLAFDVRFPIGRETNRPKYFLSIGLQGGYLYGIPFERWNSPTGARVRGGPDADFSGGFAGLTFGVGADRI
jgi:hypothetical protein